MAKTEIQKIAKELYIHQNKSEEEIAKKYKVSLRTVQRWVTKHGWKSLRDSKANGSTQRIERTQLVVDSMVEERLSILNELKELQKQKDWDSPPTKDAQESLNAQIAQLRRQAASIDDAISKWNKRIENLNKEGKITLSVYIEVMERIFEALRNSNEPLYMQTLDFQENHLEDVAVRLV